MKKIEFALQVFTLVMVLPLYAIVEMNHSAVAANENNDVREVKQNVKMVPLLKSDKSTFRNETFSLTKKIKK